VGSEEAIRVLNTDTTAQALLGSAIPARLAYIWLDGTPRVVPMWFYWTGEEFLMGAPPNAPKIRPLADQATPSLVIDDSQWPYKSLTVRGTARVELLEDILDFGVGQFPSAWAKAPKS
jgi:nitroimidazol reductase NimA-like FMN-containing flavoprotein (pyridoxamine 5'-phosphate oxidase superfamily)